MRSRKIIKKLLQIAAVLLFLVFAIPAIAYILLQSPHIQSRVAGAAVSALSKNLGSKVSLSTVDISFLYRIRLNDVYIEDYRGDTLLYASSLITGVRGINPFSRSLSLSSLDLDRAFLRVSIDTAQQVNIRIFIRQLKRQEPRDDRWKVSFSNIRITDGRFALKKYNSRAKDYGINFRDLQILSINAELRNFIPGTDSVSFTIRSLSFEELSGFRVESLSADFCQSPAFLKFGNLSILTPASRINGDHVNLSFDSWGSFRTDSLFSQVRFDIMLQNCVLALHDLGYFARLFRDREELVRLSGQVRGPLDNLKAKNVELGAGTSSSLRADLNLEGLPDLRHTFAYANIEELTTTVEDLNQIPLAGGKELQIPAQMQSLGRITYNGNFTGFIKDFVTFGEFSTGLGKVSTDLLFSPDTLNSVGFEGKMTADDFDIGKLLHASRNVGTISLYTTVNGSIASGRNLSASMSGIVRQLEVRNYRYSNISLSGDLSNKEFNGEVHMDDPNLQVDFTGRVDFSDTVAVYNFTADLLHANLYELNIDRSESDNTASFHLVADVHGNSVNTLYGDLTLANSLIHKEGRDLVIEKVELSSYLKDDDNHLELRSDFIDAELSGHYRLDGLKEELRHLLSLYLPSLAGYSGSGWNDQDVARFNLNASLKNLQPVLDLFMPAYTLAPQSKVQCVYDGEQEDFSLYMAAPKLGMRQLAWQDFNLVLTSDTSELELEAGGIRLTAGDQIRMENFTFYSRAGNDSLSMRARWHNWQDVRYTGEIRAQAQISAAGGGNLPHLDITVVPTQFYTNDTLWDVAAGKITIDSNRIAVQNLKVSHNEGFLSIQGILSADPEDNLEIDFNQFNLAHLNGITLSKGIELGGNLNGSASLSRPYDNPLLISHLTIDSLKVNGELLGNSEISSSWSDSNQSLRVDAFAMRDQLRTIDIKGQYETGEKRGLDFVCRLDKLRMNLFNPYIGKIFNNLKGIASGELQLKGTASQPVLNGRLTLQKTALGVNYLKTTYSFTDDVEVINNSLLFKDVRLYDEEGNSAYLTGSVKSSYLKDFQLDLTFRPENFLCLNTTQYDNRSFYGTAYATGLVRITGRPDNVTIDITASTTEGTSFNIPLSADRELNEYNFISLTYKDSVIETTSQQTDYQVDLSGLQLNIDLEVTPEAEVQIIFDPKLGDILKGRGSGNLDMKISKADNLVMYGEYVIEEGEYLFTLQNIINKKFNLEEGGTLVWNGDPVDATINVAANYRTKASLNDLFGTEDPRYQSATVVDDRLTMTGKLMAPDVQYSIYLPLADEETRLSVSNAIHSSEELNRQFISLLIQNRFVLSNERTGLAQSAYSASAYTNAAGVSASEFLSNQLSNWLSQISNEVDVGINYRPNREMKNDEVEVALSTQLFNDRLNINGSVDLATNAAANASQNIVGEFDIDYKLTRNGKLRIKTYNQMNNNMLYENSSYTQGFGIFYKEEFNNIGELFRRYWQALTGKKEDEVTEPTTDR